MVDNVAITEGAGTAIHADEYTHGTLGSGKTQLVKLVDGTINGDTAIKSGATSSPNALATVGPNDEFVTVDVNITRPADTTAYAINDALSDSTSAPTTFTIANAAKASGGGGEIVSLIVTSDNDPATPIQGEVFIFDSSVTSPNDNAAFAISDTDVRKVVGKIPFQTEDIGNNDFAMTTFPGVCFTCSGSADLRFLVRVKNAYTPANAEVFKFRFLIQRKT